MEPRDAAAAAAQRAQAADERTLMTATIRPLDGAPAPLFLNSIDVTTGCLTIHGDLDREHVELFLDTFDVLRSSPAPCWSVDVSGVTFCDAGGLRALLEAKRSAERGHRTFPRDAAGPWMRQLMPMIGLGAVAAPPRAVHAVR